MMSIVGIVAVMMLIIAGMRYITAAGNSASVTDAKGMALSAITGLLLALLSFVIIKTINPDVLYLKKPGSNFDAGDVVAPNNACYKNFDLVTNSCTCGDGTVITSNDVNDCISDCKVQGHCIIPGGACIRSGPKYPTGNVDSNGECHCIDGLDVEPNATAIAAKSSCDEICSDESLAVDGNYHGTKLSFLISDENMTNVHPINELGFE